MKLYAVPDGPPTLACRMALKALNLNCELIYVDFLNGEHLSPQYSALNPQMEVPTLVDDDVIIGESTAILQYICDKYDTTGKFYPKDPKARAIVNQRLCFYLAMYYRNILDYALFPLFYDYERTAWGLKKLNLSVNIFEKYLTRTTAKYVAGDQVTIADFALICSTMGLEVINFPISSYPKIEKWYNNFKSEYPELWEIAAGGLKELRYVQKNPPDMSHIDHPFHLIRKFKK